MYAAIKAIEYYVPERRLTNEQLVRECPEWTVEAIEQKTGIVERRIAGPEECSSDLAVNAAEKLFASGACRPEDVDWVLLCTQSPDYFLPTTACLVQDRLGIPRKAGALDINLGCSGFVYGLGLAKGLIETGQARNVLFLTAETYSKFIHPRDRSVRTLFGDAAAATLIQAVPAEGGEFLGPFVYGTDGSGGANLIVPTGGTRRREATGEPRTDEQGNTRSDADLYMNGPEIFTFTLRAVPQLVRDLLKRGEIGLEEIDLFVFHQANQYMLEHLRTKLKIPQDRFQVTLREYGNTVSSTIPIALKHAQAEGRLHAGDTVLLAGFGVGYSWAAALARWQGA